MDALTALIGDIKGAVADGRAEARFAPQEAARILAESIDVTRQGQLALREPRPR